MKTISPYHHRILHAKTTASRLSAYIIRWLAVLLLIAVYRAHDSLTAIFIVQFSSNNIMHMFFCNSLPLHLHPIYEIFEFVKIRQEMATIAPTSATFFI